MELPRDLGQVTEAHLQALSDARVRERRDLDFKQELNLASNTDKNEFAHDIASFANEVGGEYIVGIKEHEVSGKRTGEAGELSGIELVSTDQYEMQLASIVRDRIEPRIPGIRFHWVSLANMRKALVIRIPRSFVGPHMNKETRKFYGRDATSKIIWDVEQIRRAFLSNESIPDRLGALLNRSMLREQVGVGTYLPSARVVIQVTPLTALDERSVIDIEKAWELREQLRPPGRSHAEQRLTFDGVLASVSHDEPNTKFRNNAWLYRSGRIEAATTAGIRRARWNDMDVDFIQVGLLLQMTMDFVSRSIKLLSDLDQETPMFVAVGITRTMDYYLAEALDLGAFIDDPHQVDAPQMALPIIEFGETAPTPDVVGERLRPIIEAIANAGGYLRSTYYNDDGKVNKSKLR